MLKEKNNEMKNKNIIFQMSQISFFIINDKILNKKKRLHLKNRNIKFNYLRQQFRIRIKKIFKIIVHNLKIIDNSYGHFKENLMKSSLKKIECKIIKENQTKKKNKLKILIVLF